MKGLHCLTNKFQEEEAIQDGCMCFIPAATGGLAFPTFRFVKGLLCWLHWRMWDACGQWSLQWYLNADLYMQAEKHSLRHAISDTLHSMEVVMSLLGVELRWGYLWPLKELHAAQLTAAPGLNPDPSKSFCL